MEEWEWLKSEFSKDNLTAPENYVVENTNGKLENGYLTSSLRVGISDNSVFLRVTLPGSTGICRPVPDTKDRIFDYLSLSPQKSDAKAILPYKAD